MPLQRRLFGIQTICLKEDDNSSDRIYGLPHPSNHRKLPSPKNVDKEKERQLTEKMLRERLMGDMQFEKTKEEKKEAKGKDGNHTEKIEEKKSEDNQETLKADGKETGQGEERKQDTTKEINKVSREPSKDDKVTNDQSSESKTNNNDETIPPSVKQRAIDFFNKIVHGDNFQDLKKELIKFNNARAKEKPDAKESFSTQLNHNVKELKKSISIASRVVNDITGYSKVNELKLQIAANEKQLRTLRRQIEDAKASFSDAIEKRSESQREMNELLERKSSWVPEDLQRFTKLYMSEHDLERQVLKKKEELDKLDELDDDTHDRLVKSIMDRYHEEQVWSDKIRQFSTWGTVLIMMCNLLLVLLVQLVFEPFKRYRLVRSFEKKVRDLFDKNEEMGTELANMRREVQDSQDHVLSEVDISEKRLASCLPEQNVSVRLIPEYASIDALRDWAHGLVQSLFNFTGNPMETFTVSKYDIQCFVCFFSGLVFALGCLLGRAL